MACRPILTALCVATSLSIASLAGGATARVSGPSASVPATAMVGDRPLEAIAQTPSGYTLLHVNPTAGDDVNGDGGQMRPFQTITHALRVAAPNTIIVLSPGLYTEASGETFPLQLRSGITLQGTPNPNAANVIIQGTGTHLTPSQGLRHITLLGADQAGLANVTVSNPHPQGHGVWIEAGSPVIVQNAFVGNGATGIYIAGHGSPVIQGNYFFENGEAGLVVSGPSSAQIQNNVFENTGVGISVAPAATPVIVGNQISHNQEGLVLHAEARPQLRDNQIRDNRRNSVLDYSTWPTVASPVAAIAPPVPSPVAATPEPVSPPAVTHSAIAINPTAEAVAIAAPTTAPDFAPLPVAEPAPVVSPATIGAPATPAAEPPTAAAPESVPPVTIEVASSAVASSPIAPSAVAPSPSGEAIEPDNPPADLAPIALPGLNDDAIPIAVEPGLTAPSASPAAAPVETSRSDNLRARLRQRLNDANASNANASNANVTNVAVVAPTAAADAITIPVVPAPHPDPAVTVAPLVTPSTAPRGPISSNILIVPGQNIPIGNGGSATVSLATNAAAADGPPPPPSRATTLGLYYRVFVETHDQGSRTQLEALVPDAFQVRVNGQPVMQAGAFSTLGEAQATADRLNQAGLRARVEYIP